MGHRCLAVTVASAVLATAAALFASPVQAGPPPAAPAQAAPAPTPQPSAQSRPPFVACPVAPIPPPPPHPPRPVPPPRDPTRPAIGGEGLSTDGLTLPAGAPAPPGNLTARSWLVADLDTGAVVGACGPHVQSPPASVQKLLLAAAALPKLDPAQVIEVTPDDLNIERGSSAVGLVVGGRYPIATLWLGLLLQSGNDAANALARLAGAEGGVPATLASMNALAQHLGAHDTHAATPSGLDGPGQFTSVYDLALIARACFAREDFRRYDTTLTAQMPAQPNGRAFQFQNENKLLTRYPGALGGKTGFTELARHTYVGAAERNGRRLVVTLLNAEAQPVRAWQQGASLLDWGFTLPADASVGRLVAPGELAAKARESVRPTTPPAGAGGGSAVAAQPARDASRPARWSPGTVGALVAALVLATGLTFAVALRPRPGRRRSVGRRRVGSEPGT